MEAIGNPARQLNGGDYVKSGRFGIHHQEFGFSNFLVMHICYNITIILLGRRIIRLFRHEKRFAAIAAWPI